MFNNGSFTNIFRVLAQKLSELKANIITIIKQCLAAKKIVIISEKGISSLPVSFKFQAIISVFVLLSMIWVSYSTGKYFAYEDIISEKDREIWDTNATKQDLQYQVADLNDNLVELNKYFDKIKRLDQLAKNKDKIFKGKKRKDANIAPATKSEKHSKKDQENAKFSSILSNIRNKVSQRISSLESIIGITGLDIEKIADNNIKLKESLPNKSASNQGGPLEPTSAQISDHTDFEDNISYLLELENTIHSMPLIAPMKRYWISSTYGKRKDPIRKVHAYHGGLDLVGAHKSKVYTTAPGVIKFAGTGGAYGRMIEVDHGSGITTRYGHLSKLLVKKGEQVKRGQVVGLQGSTGRSTGPHLHYEVRYNKKTYDPKNFLKAGKYVF